MRNKVNELSHDGREVQTPFLLQITYSTPLGSYMQGMFGDRSATVIFLPSGGIRFLVGLLGVQYQGSSIAPVELTLSRAPAIVCCLNHMATHYGMTMGRDVRHSRQDHRAPDEGMQWECSRPSCRRCHVWVVRKGDSTEESTLRGIRLRFSMCWEECS
jgi:hypothetical protein